jgi:hypothetical protein
MATLITQLHGGKLVEQSIDTRELKNDGVTTDKINENAVTNRSIDNTADYTVNAVTITAGATVGTTLTVDAGATFNGGMIANAGATFNGSINQGLENFSLGNNALTFNKDTGAISINANALKIFENAEIDTQNVNSLPVVDGVLLLNKGGSEEAANTGRAGVEIDGTNQRIAYNNTVASKMTIGEIGGLESEIITAEHTQTLSSKTYLLTGPQIQGQSNIEAAVRVLDEKNTAQEYSPYVRKTLDAGNVAWDIDTQTYALPYDVAEGRTEGVMISVGGQLLVQSTEADILDFSINTETAGSHKVIFEPGVVIGNAAVISIWFNKGN